MQTKRIGWRRGGRALAAAAGIALGAMPALGMNYSTPYVRDGLPVVLGAMGYGADIGVLEVNNSAGSNGFVTHANTADWGLQTLADVQNFSGFAAATDDSAHGTSVARIMDNLFTYGDSGSGPFASTPYYTTWSVGMAPRAQYHGALFDGNDTKAATLSLNSSLAYLTSTAHVQAINCSWGAMPNSQAELNGSSLDALLLDEYTGYKGKTGGTAGGYRDALMVVAAGNEGETTGLLRSPADSYNVLTVGAQDVGNPSFTIDDPARTPLPKVAPFSSWRPLANGRSGVDVVAPGSYIAIVQQFKVDPGYVLAGFSGVVGSGTSFAAPHVTGEAAILYGATNIPLDQSESIVVQLSTTEKGHAFSSDHKLIKALIINSADKIRGLSATGAAQSRWQPGQVVIGPGGVPNAVVPLNYAVGAGEANANEAYLGYREVSNRFWSVNTLTQTGEVDTFDFGGGMLVDETSGDGFLLSLKATLVWDRHVDLLVNTNPGDSSDGILEKDLLSNLDLVLQKETVGGTWEDVYLSAGTLDNLEHIYIPQLSGYDHYRLEVVGTSLVDPLIDGSYAESYALAIAFGTAVPEPGMFGVLLVVMFGAAARRRRVPVSD